MVTFASYITKHIIYFLENKHDKRKKKKKTKKTHAIKQ